MRMRLLLLGLVVAASFGCASQATQDARLGPTFSAAEKELMTDDEKLAIYNAQVRDEDKLECEMVTIAGSHHPQKVCQTRREREWNRDSAHEALRDSRRFQRCGMEGTGACPNPNRL